MKILVIDDDRAFREYLVSLLERAGHQALGLDSGLYLDSIPDLSTFHAVVTDLYMPDVDGIETVRGIKRKAPQMPIIGMTGRHQLGQDPCLYAMTAFGAAAVLMKPLNETALLAVLQRVARGPSESPAERPAGAGGD